MKINLYGDTLLQNTVRDLAQLLEECGFALLQLWKSVFGNIKAIAEVEE